jgi:hypothetical protein
MRQLTKLVKVLLLAGLGIVAILLGGTAANAQGWRHGYGGGYYHHGGWGHGGGYYDNWHRGYVVPGPAISVYYGPSYYHYHHWGHRRYYWYNGNRWYLDLNTGIRVEL